MCNICNKICQYFKDISFCWCLDGCKLTDLVKQVLGTKLVGNLNAFQKFSAKRVLFYFLKFYKVENNLIYAKVAQVLRYYITTVENHKNQRQLDYYTLMVKATIGLLHNNGTYICVSNFIVNHLGFQISMYQA